MSKSRRVLRKSAIVVPLLAMTTALLVVHPAVAAGSKQYVASISVVPAGSAVTITVTFTNMPGSAALGSAQVSVPLTYTVFGTPTTSTAPVNKIWNASRSGNLITITAKSDSQKIQPGQSVSVIFNATPPTASNGDIFRTKAKAATDFTGSSVFTNLGADPTVTICTSGQCYTSFGDTSNPPRDVQTGQASLDNGCTGTCIVTMNGTAGDFCPLAPTPNTPCHTHVGPDLKISGYTGGVTFVLACNSLDCPVISGGPTFTPVDFYRVYIDKNDGPTMPGDTVLKIENYCGGEDPGPCLVLSGTGRFPGGEGSSARYQSTLEFPFPLVDPKIMH